MAIIKQKSKGRTYIYESRSYRNEEGKPRTMKKIIGKIDPTTGKRIYKKEYLERKKAESTPIEAEQDEKSYPTSAIKKSEIKNYGAYYLYNRIAEKIGLTDLLREVFPDNWQQIQNIACYLVTSGEPVMYCIDWAEQTEILACNGMSPTSISNLFKEITINERNEFFGKWSKHRCEQEYLALDITSVSSYSELIESVEWGYNRDKEKLAQINLCLLMGEESGLPVFQTLYNGSLKDVSTLTTTLQLVSSLAINKIALVMDKGFCSIKNVDAMLADKHGLRFLISVPFNLTFAKERVSEEKPYIDCIENIVLIGNDSLHAVTRVCTWGKEKVFTHIYYNAIHAANVKEDLYANIASVLNTMKNNPSYVLGQSSFKKYIRVIKPDLACESLGLVDTIEVNYVEVEKTLAHAGWLVIVSNHVSDAFDAISIYRAKDVVEKGFLGMKNSLELGRLRVHSDVSTQNKVFICFIALIFRCFIHRVMLNKGLYCKMTLKKLVLTLDKLKVQYISGDRILFPLSKDQKDIYDAFDFVFPL